MANVVPAGSLYKFLSHKRKVLALYKKAQRHLEFYCAPQGRDVYAYEHTLLRARFDKHKNETDPERATQLLRLGEEEFWENQHPMPIIFSNEPGGVAWERPVKNQVPEAYMNEWDPKYKAMFPDYFENREKWYKLKQKTWDDEISWLKEWDKKNIEKGVKMTDAMPAAKERDGFPPFWWRFVTKPLEKPKLMDWFPNNGDKW
uniref:NADH dehydrogenase [ubiquinone] 1 beta subcomplex subunit 9 n=1 Tax=Phallusia mammillata TaxID=59560 RepID=A0A6F9DLF0_9ASCI|nr:NADH dehydrogenase [ubiquinone] 1 beta subcomplex subunit 9-like [Phallusia mammillata]